MSESISQFEYQVKAFFNAIQSWRKAYAYSRLNYLGIRNSAGELLIVSARIILSGVDIGEIKPKFKSGNIEAGQWNINQNAQSIEELLKSLTNKSGLNIHGQDIIRLSTDDIEGLHVSDPILLHPEGLSSGSRLSVLSMYGDKLGFWLNQPETDWSLKSADMPFDSLQELLQEYGLGYFKDGRSVIEVVGRSAIEVFHGSEVKGGVAKIGIWLTKSLDRAAAKIGYRVLSKGQVIARSSISGNDLDWSEESQERIGTKSISIPPGSVLQCIVSYDNKTHHVSWRADVDTFQNSRAAAFSLVDPNQTILNGCLFPDPQAKGRTADDFETGICWLLWVLGFSPAIFGVHPKTRDGLDIVATSPKGDYLVIECTLGLLRSESKLSKLGARAVQLRKSLDASNLTHLQILPIIATALSREEVEADIATAEELGILVLAKEDIEKLFNTLSWFPNPDSQYEQATTKVITNKEMRKSINGGEF